MKKISMSKVTMILLASLASTSSTYAADLTASSSTPRINFVDTDSGTNVIDIVTTDGGFFNIYDPVNNDWIIWGYSTGNSSNTFQYDSSGDINLADGSVFIDRSEKSMGIGTVAPETSLHIAGDGDIRSDYSGHGWKLDNNGAWFNIGSTTTFWPFSIHEDAPAMSLQIVADGDIGLGTNSPQAKLDVRGDIEATWSGSNTVGDGLTNLITLSATNSDVGGSITSDAGFRLVNGSTSKGWNFRTNSGGDSFQATLQGTGGSEFTVTNATANVSGTELYLGNGAKNVGGVWINASSRALKENIKPLSTKEALTAFSKLQPVTYNYKTDKSEKVVGFIAEDVPELVSINSRDGLSSMDMVAVLTKVVQEQDKSLAETKAELKKAQEKIAKLETMQKRLAKVESLLTNLALDTSNSKTEEVAFNTK